MISEHASPLAGLGSADSGGRNVYVAQLARLLASNGHEVDVFTRRDDPDLTVVVPWQDGSRVIHVPAGPPGPIPKEQPLPRMGAFARYVQGCCARRPYDLVHAHFWMSGMVASEIKAALGVPFVVTFHALGRIRRRHQGTNDRFPDCRFEIEERIVRDADCLIAEWPQDHEDLIEHYGADPELIATVPCGFDPGELWPVPRRTVRARLGLDRDAFIVLQLGRMVPRKGIDTVVQGFSRFRSDASRAQLLIVGGDAREPDPQGTPEIARLQTLARTESVSDRIRFTGRRDREELKYYCSTADMVIPKRETSWP